MRFNIPFSDRLPGMKLLSRLPNRVNVHPPESVTTIGAESSPLDVGLSQEDVERIWQSVVDYYMVGLQPAMSLCIRRGGRVILHRTIGHARGNGPGESGPLIQATPKTLFNMFSASKCVTAMLIHLLDDRGQVHVDDPVAEYIPEFARHGKQHITIRHILTHRAGIPLTPPEQICLDTLSRPEAVIAGICEAKPISLAGRKQAYHALTGGFILAEIAQRVTGCSIRELLHTEVCQPLGFDHFLYGVSETDLGKVARESFTGPKPPGVGKWLIKRSIGLDIQQAVALANDPRFLTSVVPSGNIIATSDEVGRFFELLLRLGELDGVRVFPSRTIRRAVAEHRSPQLDGVIVLPVRYGLGMMLGGERASFFGSHTPRAFGHLGFTNVLGWADPERDISVAFLNNGKPFVTPELVAWMRVMRVIASVVPRDYGGVVDSPWRSEPN